MADGTKMVDRGGRRVRLYHRQDASRPGQQLRRLMAAQGQRWCRYCGKWLAAGEVGKNGLCRPHENADAARRYAQPGAYRDGRKRHAIQRKRGVDPVPTEGGALVLELFQGECAYCPDDATTWDHVEPVSAGGQTVPGNIVPACRPCNSAKGTMDIEVWLDRAPIVKPVTVEYLAHAGRL